MKDNAMPDLCIRRILHVLPGGDGMLPVYKRTGGKCGKEPLILRRSYDFSVSCARQNSPEEDAIASVRLCGEHDAPLWRCVSVCAAVIGAAAAAAALMHFRREWQIRRKYARRYADRLKKYRHRTQQNDGSMANSMRGT